MTTSKFLYYLTRFHRGAALYGMVAMVGLLFYSSGAHAQLIASGRYEKELKSSDNGFTMIPVEKGIALLREKNKFNNSKRLWEFVFLDESLEEKWKSDIEVKSNYDLIGYEYGANHVYYLFREGDRDSNKFELVQISTMDFAVTTFEIKHEFALRLTHFSITGENAILGGYVSREPAVMLFDTKEKQIKVVPGFFLKDTELLDLKANYNETFNALLIERNALDTRHLVLKTFDSEGALLLEDYIEIEKEKNLITGISSRLKREELFIVGTYTEGVSTEALGYYSVFVDPFVDQKIQFYPFPTLTHLLDHLPEKRASKIKTKSKERMDLGKNPDYKAHIQPIRIDETPEGFYFLSEMYDPASSVDNRPYWNNSYQPYYGYGNTPYSYNPFMNRYADNPYTYNGATQNTTVKMTEAVLALFDNKGKLTWDTSLAFDGLKLYTLDQTSDFVVRRNLIYLAYKKESDLMVSTSSFEQETEMDTLKVPLKSPSEIIRYETEEDTGVRHWYDHFFFVWGYQSIRSTERNEEDPIRYVFYINKFEAE